MLHKAIDASATTDVTAEISRLRAWCASKGVSADESSLLARQVEIALSDLKTAALAVSSAGSTFHATRSIKTDNCSVEVTFKTELPRSRVAEFFKRIGLG